MENNRDIFKINFIFNSNIISYKDLEYLRIYCSTDKMIVSTESGKINITMFISGFFIADCVKEINKLTNNQTYIKIEFYKNTNIDDIDVYNL